MTETKQPGEQTKFDRIKAFAESEKLKGGFVYCFRGEVEEGDKPEGYVNERLKGSWYSEDIRTTKRFLKEREDSSGEKGKIFAVVVPRSLLTTGRDEIDSARKIINIVNQDILSSRVLLDDETVDKISQFQESGEPAEAGIEMYLAQFRE